MKCKVFKIHLENDFDETKLNEFLETVNPQQIYASVVGSGETAFWSVLILHEDDAARAQKPSRLERIAATRNESDFVPETTEQTAPIREAPPAARSPEPIQLTAEQENFYSALRNWRNERASRDGVPPYLIAHNDSLMQMATMTIKTPEDLLQVKGLGEKRVQKYGDEILQILSAIKN